MIVSALPPYLLQARGARNERKSFSIERMRNGIAALNLMALFSSSNFHRTSVPRCLRQSESNVLAAKTSTVLNRP